MLVVPFLAGAVLGGLSPWHPVLLAAWLVGYASVYHAQQYLRLRRIARRPEAPRRHLPPLAGLGAAFACLGIALAIARPWLVLAAAAMLPLLAVNAMFAARNQERAMVNGIIAVIPACGMVCHER